MGLQGDITLVIYRIQECLIKMCLNEIPTKVFMGKHFPHAFPILNGLKQGDTL